MAHLSIRGSDDWTRTKLVLALGADLTRAGFWSQQRRCMVLGEGERINEGYDWRSGIALSFAKEIQMMVRRDYRKAQHVGRLVELLQEEVSLKVQFLLVTENNC